MIKALELKDLEPLVKTFTFPWSNSEATWTKWTKYFEEQGTNIRTVYLVQNENEFIGYASLLRYSAYPNFCNAAIPEIHDVWISEKWRQQGFGKQLVQHIERIAQEEGYSQIGLGVGLYRDYGAAQKLYFTLGYKPDGNGITYQSEIVVPGESYPVDDDLNLWLTKKLN